MHGTKADECPEATVGACDDPLAANKTGVALDPALRAAEGRQSLGRLLAREVSDPLSVERGIIQDLLDPIAATVTDLLQATQRERSAAEIHWAYQMIVGTMTFIMVDAGRIRRISGGACDPENVDATIQHIVPLILDGLRNGRVTKAE
jgi:hypothetical protein